MRILVVCRANMFRSPLAAALLAKGAELHAMDWEVSSAGLDAPNGMPAAPEARALAHEFGCDIDLHLTRRVDPEKVDEFDKVLVMEPKQVRAMSRHVRDPKNTRVECLAGYLPANRDRFATASISDPASKPREEMRRVGEELAAAAKAFLGAHTGAMEP